MTDDETLSVYDDQIEAYAGMVGGLQSDKNLKKFIDLVGNGARVLDLGCGPGHHAAAMRDGGLLVEAMDASAEMVRYARETYNIDAKQAGFDEVSKNTEFAGVWANFSLLHVSRKDFVRHLDQIHACLIDKGVFHIGMKLGTGEKRDKLGRFYTFYSEEELKQKLHDAGFAVLHERTGSEKGLAGSIEPWITILSQK